MPDARIRRYSRDPIRDEILERKESMTGFSMSFWSLQAWVLWQACDRNSNNHAMTREIDRLDSGVSDDHGTRRLTLGRQRTAVVNSKAT
jgi:hypothetical protein